MKQCTATRSNGQRCKAQVLTEGDLCFIHNPANQDRIDEARRKGGKNKSNTTRAQKRMPREVRDIVQIVEAAMGGVLQGKITPSQGHATASLVGAWVKLRETGELEQRLAELEERAAQQGGKRQWA